MKGIFAVFILIHHLYQHSRLFTGTLLAPILQAMGYLSVAIFFFISGFGVESSYKKKGKAYIEKFPRNRVLSLYVDCLVLIMIYAVLYLLIDTRELSLRLMLTSLTWGDTVIVNGWYLQGILVLYLLYWFVYRFTHNRSSALLFVGLLLYCIVCFVVDSGITKYQSIFTFLVGVLWANNKEKVDKAIDRIWGICTLISFIMFSSTFLLGWRLTLFNMLSAVFFVVLVMLLIMKIPVNNAVTRWLGKYSFEIYVMQGIPLLLLHSNILYIENQWLYVLLCTAVTLILAVAIHPVFQFINRTVKREVIS